MIQELSTELAGLVEAARPAVATVSAPGAVPRSAIALEGGLYLTPAFEAEVGEIVTIVRADAPGEGIEGRVARFWPGVNIALLTSSPPSDTPAEDESGSGERTEAIEALKSLASAGTSVTGMRVGSVAITVAFPSPEGVEARLGIVRCLGSDGSYFQTDSAAFPGFAGAPVFDETGSLTGMTLPGRGGNDSVVLPLDQIAAILEGTAPARHDRSRRGVLGVTTEPITLPHGGATGSAAVVLTVQEDSAAARAGLRYGDIITQIDDEPVDGPHSLAHRLHGRESGEEITLGIVRAGEPTTVSVTLGEMSPEEATRRGARRGHRGGRPWRRWSTMNMMG